MRIRKVSQPTPIVPGTAQITDTYSTSTSDGYSCNYANSRENEMIGDYIVTGNESTITFSNLNIVPGEMYKFRFVGCATAEADIFLRINGQTTDYYNTGRYDTGTLTGSGELAQNASYRPNNVGFYYANHVSTRLSVIDGTISIKYNPEVGRYNPMVTWKSRIGWQNRQLISDAFGFYAPDTQQITSISFPITNAGVTFKPGTRIQIIKVNNEGFTI